jgi:hypothetical protein
VHDFGFLFLILNASVVWAVFAGFMTWIMRSKLFVLVVMIAPYIIGSAFRDTPGMQSLLGMSQAIHVSGLLLA